MSQNKRKRREMEDKKTKRTREREPARPFLLLGVSPVCVFVPPVLFFCIVKARAVAGAVVENAEKESGEIRENSEGNQRWPAADPRKQQVRQSVRQRIDNQTQGDDGEGDQNASGRMSSATRAALVPKRAIRRAQTGAQAV